MGAVIQEWESMWDNGGKMTATGQECYHSRCYTEHLWLQIVPQNLEKMFLLYLKCKIEIDDLTLRLWTSSSVFDPALRSAGLLSTAMLCELFLLPLASDITWTFATLTGFSCY